MKSTPFALLAAGLLSLTLLGLPTDFDKEWDSVPPDASESATTPLEARRLSSLNGVLSKATHEKKPKIFRIMLDPGHGGKDLGTRGPNGYLEKNLCLWLARLVKNSTQVLFENKAVPIEIVMTRDGDSFIPLRERTRKANSLEADLFISLHANSEPSLTARGFEVYFTSPESTDRRANRLALLENSERSGEKLPSTPVLRMLADSQNAVVTGESSRFAEVMFESLSSYLESSVRAVRQAPFSVLSHTVMPSLLVEVGYLSHAKDAKRLQNPRYLKKVASAISQGILDYATRQNGKRQKNDRVH